MIAMEDAYNAQLEQAVEQVRIQSTYELQNSYQMQANYQNYQHQLKQQIYQNYVAYQNELNSLYASLGAQRQQ